MDLEEARKRQAGEVAIDGEEGSDVKRPKPAETQAEPQHDSAEEHDDEDDCMSAWLALDKDAVSELLSLLEPAEWSPSSSSSAGATAFNFKVKFTDDPYASLLVFQSSSSFVTINGNEETCGSSFSESESTVMASIDTRGICATLRDTGDEVGRSQVPERGGGASALGSEEARGCDWAFGVDDDDDTVAGFLGAAAGGDGGGGGIGRDAFDWTEVNAGCR